jgi:hypothetical protein
VRQVLSRLPSQIQPGLELAADFFGNLEPFPSLEAISGDRHANGLWSHPKLRLAGLEEITRLNQGCPILTSMQGTFDPLVAQPEKWHP